MKVNVNIEFDEIGPDDQIDLKKVEEARQVIRRMFSEDRAHQGFPNLFADQDDCLIHISDGKKPPASKLRALPAWRAVLIARVARQALAMTKDELDALIEDARNVGPDNKLEMKP